MNKREWMLQAAIVTMRAGATAAVAESWVSSYGRLYDAIVAATPTAEDEGWIEHRGEKPYPEGMVEVQEADGEIKKGLADDFFWDHMGMQSDIIAWRPARA